MAALIALTVLLLRSPADVPAISVDSSVLRQAERRLASLERELSALPDPAKTASSSRVEIHGCHVDSGDIFQPWIGRTWEIADASADAAALEIVESMHLAGWSGTVEPSRHGSFEVSSPRDGWVAHARIGTTLEKDGVYLVGRVVDAVPCALSQK